MESRAAYQPWDVDENRFERGLRLTRKSWDLLRQNPRLALLPGAAAIAVTIAGVLLFDPALYVLRHEGGKLPIALALAALMLPMTLVTTYFNVAFVVAINDQLEGREVSVRRGLRVANSRI